MTVPFMCHSNNKILMPNIVCNLILVVQVTYMSAHGSDGNTSNVASGANNTPSPFALCDEWLVTNGAGGTRIGSNMSQI